MEEHATEFAALGAALMLLIHEYALRRGLLWAWGIGTLYAGTDELHQLFKGTRTPALRDVAIDSAGVLFGVLCVALLLYIIDRWKGKRTA
jgi:VanZ family protein